MMAAANAIMGGYARGPSGDAMNVMKTAMAAEPTVTAQMEAMAVAWVPALHTAIPKAPSADLQKSSMPTTMVRSLRLHRSLTMPTTRPARPAARPSLRH